MNIISWNCRGLVAASTITKLKDLYNQVKPALFFLMETRAKLEKVEETKRKLGFDDCFCVEPVDWSGGLCLFWKKEMEVEILEECKNYIHTHYKSKLYIHLYQPQFNERKHLWGIIERLHTGTLAMH